MDSFDRDLGMGRAISRRDFLNGVAVAPTSAAVGPSPVEAFRGTDQALSPEQAPDYYPPLRTGLRGSHSGSFEAAHQLRDAKTPTPRLTWYRAVGEVIESRTRHYLSHLRF
jgi:spermidine dehydrogenase